MKDKELTNAINELVDAAKNLIDLLDNPEERKRLDHLTTLPLKHAIMNYAFVLNDQKYRIGQR